MHNHLTPNPARLPAPPLGNLAQHHADAVPAQPPLPRPGVPLIVRGIDLSKAAQRITFPLPAPRDYLGRRYPITVSLQAEPEASAWTTAVIALKVSNDGEIYREPTPAVRVPIGGGFAPPADVSPYARCCVEVVTAEGSSCLARIAVVLA